jgi:hypothetical protein
MLYFVPNRNGFAWSFFSLTMSFGLLLSLTACNKQGPHASDLTYAQIKCNYGATWRVFWAEAVTFASGIATLGFLNL